MKSNILKKSLFYSLTISVLSLSLSCFVPQNAFSANTKAPIQNEQKANTTNPADVEVLKKASLAYQEKKYTEAINLLKPLADKGNTDAQFALGLIYVRGEGVKADPNLVKEYWTKSANAGHPEAQFNLGMAYIRGIFGKRSATDAVKWWEKAANQGHGDAYYALGQIYKVGDGVKKDEKKSASYNQKGLELGHPGCAYELGVAYAKGAGVPKDMNKAKTLLKEAADKGDQVALDVLKNIEKNSNTKNKKK
ncbi:tetratricopeptide repeat protein [Desulfovibrio litoralis]|uniref:Sel1 repeat-containing protein n=1 Tax=Desulfovibrio litoralis DSM 11393 TaxID=1121455 RepID=A0A1M7SX62_9BACT|nr:tetratricopeptide repeat protein [Desulfovibrio litoralis]SHN63069.1 Sel1 repeat-containing protein [Desulfovibrio litoralis DSM 11393]